MTELEKIVYTKDFIDKLANGINPLEGTSIPEGDLLNNVRLTRCMFYVSDILRQVIEQGGFEEKTAYKRPRRKAFSITQEERERFEFSDMPISISEFGLRLYALIDTATTRRISYSKFTKWLVRNGLLSEDRDTVGRKRRRPTAAGEELGMMSVTRTSSTGEIYETVVYDRNAQQFLLDHIEGIAAEK